MESDNKKEQARIDKKLIRAHNLGVNIKVFDTIKMTGGDYELLTPIQWH